MALKAARTSDTRNSESLYLGGQYAEILDFLCSPVTGLANVKVLISEQGLAFTSRGGRSLDPISNNKCLTKSLGLNSVQNTNAVRASPLIRSIAERSSTVLPISLG
jgi:hypothetical protein